MGVDVCLLLLILHQIYPAEACHMTSMGPSAYVQVPKETANMRYQCINDVCACVLVCIAPSAQF